MHNINDIQFQKKIHQRECQGYLLQVDGIKSKKPHNLRVGSRNKKCSSVQSLNQVNILWF